jgi:hypothetical protein
MRERERERENLSVHLIMRKSAKFNSTDIGNNIYLNSTSGHEEGWTRLSLCTLGTSKLLLELFRRNADTPLTICILFYNSVPLELQLYYPHPPPTLPLP